MPAPGPHPALPTAAQQGETRPGRGNRPWHWPFARPSPAHPILLAAYFVLILYSVNLGEAEIGEVLPVLTTVAVATVVLLLLGGLPFRDVRRAAIVLPGGIVALLAHGHVNRLLGSLGIGLTLQQTIRAGVGIDGGRGGRVA
jgi:hypothetical protein